MLKISLFLIFSFNLFAFDCSTQSENLDYPNLDWTLGSKYNVYSSVINIEGILCVGFSKSKQVSRVHYFDDLGTKILKTANELMDKDVVFFSRSVMPSYAKVLLKRVDPMTLSLKKVSKNKFEFRLTFVENMMKSFRGIKVREILIDVDSTSRTPTFKHESKIFDEFQVNVNNSMRIYSVKTFFEGELINSHSPSHYKLTSRID